MTLDERQLKQRLTRFWDQEARSYDPVDGRLSGAAPAWRAWLAEALGPTPLSVLDLGAGTGFLTLPLAELGHTVIGLDQSPAMLARLCAKAAARGLSLTLIRADAEQLPLADASVDVVISRWLLWLLPHPARAAREWRRVVRPGGRVLALSSIEAYPPAPSGITGWARRQAGLALSSLAERRNAWHWRHEGQRIDAHLPLARFDMQARADKLHALRYGKLTDLRIDPLDAINDALGRTRQPQAFRHRLLTGGDGRSYFYALIARRRREDDDD
ncbi:MAG: class I SAM-dependent methyltransferase [Chloroflexi bacterium]|nr:class I SAM-dependent methyltransferase [Chloroflexota bacterium]